MLDVGLFRNLRFSAASGAVTITFFSLMGFIFMITLYFQFLKGYGPLSTGVRLLPVATLTGITSVLGTRLAVRSGTKLVVAGGLVSLAVGLAWASTASGSTSYLTIAGQMVLIGSGIGLTSAPATESIMGAVPEAKAGVGSASTTRPGSSAGPRRRGDRQHLRVALRQPPDGGAPRTAAGFDRRQRERSVGTAFGAAASSMRPGSTAWRRGCTTPHRTAFFDGFQTAVLVAAGIALAGAVEAAILIPNQPPESAPR